MLWSCGVQRSGRSDSRWCDELFLRAACDLLAREVQWDTIDAGRLHRSASQARTADGTLIVVAVLSRPELLAEALDDARKEAEQHGLPEMTPLWLYVPDALAIPAPGDHVVVRRVRFITFSCSLDRTGRIVTAIAAAVPVLIIATALVVGPWLLALPITVVLSLFTGMWWFQWPRRYRLSEGIVSVDRALGQAAFSTAFMDSAELVMTRDLGRTRRVLGSGGAGGYWGTFNSETLGSFESYVTRWDTLVLVRIAGGRLIMFSPDEPAAFRAALLQVRA